MKLKLPKILAALILLSNIAFAQNDLSSMYSNHFPLATARYQPSKLGEGFKSVEIMMPSLYVFTGNKVFNIQDIATLGSQNGSIDAATFQKYLDRMESKNLIGTGLTIPVIGVAIKLKTKDGDHNNPKDEKMAFSYDMALRSGLTFSYPKDVFSLAFKGNKTFEGKTAILNPNATVNTFVEHAIGFSMPLPIKLGDKLKLKAGVRVKYLQGIASSKINGDMSLYTAPQGRYVDVTGDLTVNNAAPNTNNFLTGSGIGTDLGVTATILEKFTATVSLLDLGFINYSKNASSYSINKSYRYEGVNLSDVISNPNNAGNGAGLEKIQNEFKPQENNKPFNMSLPTRIVVQGEYIINKETPKGRPYKMGNVFLTYVQGVNNMPGGTTKPFVSAGYSHSIRTCLNVGATVAVGGYNNFMAGTFFSVRGGFFRFGIGTSNVLPLVGLGYGSDISMKWSMSF